MGKKANWIHLAQGNLPWRALVNTEMKLKNAENFLTERSISVSRRNLLYGVRIHWFLVERSTTQIVILTAQSNALTDSLQGDLRCVRLTNTVGTNLKDNIN